MKLYVQTAYRYIRYYFTRSLFIIASMVLSIALIVGIETLSNSAKQSNIDQMLFENGSHHVRYRSINRNQSDLISNSKETQLVGFTQYYDSVVEDELNLVRTDENYIKLCNSKFIEGRMPKKEGEIALESWVLTNMNKKYELGAKIPIHLYLNNLDRTYTLVGILEDRVAEKSAGIKEGFLSIEGIDTGEFDAYVKFEDKVNIAFAITTLQKTCIIKEKNVIENNSVLEAIDTMGYQDGNIIKSAIIIALFAGMVIFSIFNISVLQRTSEYGTLKAIGAKSFQLFRFIFSELFILYLVSIPIGIGVGILGAKVLSPFAGMLFTEGEVKISKMILTREAVLLPVSFLIIIIGVISFLLCKKIGKISPIAAITKNFANSKINKITSTKLFKNKITVTQELSIRNIMRNKKAFIITVVTIAMGGIIFIVSNFRADLYNTDLKLNAKSYTSMNADYKISSSIYDFKKAVSDKEITQLRSLNGVKAVFPTQVKFGGVTFDSKLVKMPHYYDEINEKKYIKSQLNGVFTKDEKSNNYFLKSCILGYEEATLNDLKPYLLEGTIDIEKMNNEDVILFRMPVDYRGKYVFDINTGDKIKVKFPKSTILDSEIMKMPPDREYVEKEFIVGGIVSSIIDTCDYYANKGGEVIFSNKKFEEVVGYKNYPVVSVNIEGKADHIQIYTQILEITSKIADCNVRDLYEEVNSSEAYQNQKRGYIYAITLILLIIGLFNIMNNISYSLISRISEFSIIRAIGLDNKGFKKMILFEGLVYGGVSGIITLIGSLIGQIIVFITITDGYINPQFTINYGLYFIILLVNLSIGFIATYFPSRKMKDISIVEAINNNE